MGHSQDKFTSTRFHLSILAVVLAVVGTMSFRLATYYVPIGEGPDELSHIDYTRFLLNHNVTEIDVRAGLASPCKAPLGQGHQPPLSYFIGAQLIRGFYNPDVLGEMVDYAAGITYSSAGRLFGGTSACSYGVDSWRNDSATLEARAILHFLRNWNICLLLISIALTYAAGRLLFDKNVAFVASVIHASIPAAVYRSIFVSNDNLTAALSSLAFVSACFLCSRRTSSLALPVSAVHGVICGLTFLSKYSGIVTLLYAPCLLLAVSDIGKKKWFILNAVAALCFLATASWDLYLNLTIDGDLFSTAVLQEVVPFLFRPSSFWQVLTAPTFLPVVFERFWVNFHVLGPGIGSGLLPIWVLPSWYLLMLLSGFGVLGNIATKRHREKLAALLCILIGMLLLIIVFATKYPLPAGRYLHSIVAPLSLLLACGLSGFLRNASSRRAPMIGVVVLSCLFIASSWFTYDRLKNEFERCKGFNDAYVEGGVEFSVGDINGDSTDELLFFHRIRNRLFVAKQEAQSFIFQPQLTHLVGLVADEFAVADLNGDGLDDPVFRRVGASLWNVIDATSLAEVGPAHNVPIPSKFTPDSQAAIADLDKDGKVDLALYFPIQGRWKIYASRREQGSFTRQLARMLKAEKGRVGFVLQNRDSVFLATYDPANGTLSLRDPMTSGERSVQVPARIHNRLPLVTSSANAVGLVWRDASKVCLLNLEVTAEPIESSMRCTTTPMPFERVDEWKLLVQSFDQSLIKIVGFHKRSGLVREMDISIEPDGLQIEKHGDLISFNSKSS